MDIKNQTQSFPCPRSRFQELADSTREWLATEDFRCQKLQTEDGGTLLQVEKTGGWRKFLGMSTALNVVFRQLEETVEVDIGEGRWIDKAAVGVIGILVLWPLTLVAGIGAWKQMKMPERIFGYIDGFLDQEGQEA